MKINYEKLEQAIAGDHRALTEAFDWYKTTQGIDHWYDQRMGKKTLDIEALKAMRKTPSIQVGEVYTDEAGNHRECIFVDGNKAYMRHKNGDGDAAYIWDVSTGKSICFGWGYHINLTPKPVTKIDTPTLWRDMTDAEKGKLLLAKHENKDIEESVLGIWWDFSGTMCPAAAYRIKPSPVVETVVLHGRNYITKVCPNGVWDFDRNEVQIGDTHNITFKTIDGEPDCSSITMEKLNE